MQLSQTEFANRLGCSDSTISIIEKGDREITRHLALQIEKLAGIPWHTLYPDSPFDEQQKK